MSAPFIWIIVPIMLAGLFFLWNKWENFNYFVSITISAWLTWLAWIFPIGQILEIGDRSIKLGDSFTILGRSLTISEIDKPIIIFFYTFLTFWLIGGWVVKPSKFFVAYVYLAVSLMIAALSVEPFLFAALIIEILVLLSVSQFLISQIKIGKGVFRFLSLYTLGMPFILFTGWMLVGAEVSPDNLDIVVRAGVLLGLGFSFLLFFIPFHSWIPMLAEETHPYIFSFLLFFLPGVEIMFGLGFLNELAWLRNSDALYVFLQSMGGLMILLGGIWAFLEKSLSRIFAYLIVFEMGWSLLFISVGQFSNLQFFFYSWMLRGIFYWIIGISLNRIKIFNWDDLSLKSLIGIAPHLPVESIAVLLSMMSLAGLPLFSNFPIYINLIGQLIIASKGLVFIIFLGIAGMVSAVLRLLLIFYVEEEEIVLEGDVGYVNPIIGFVFKYSTNPSLSSRWFFTIFLIGIVLTFGLFPNRFINLFSEFSLLYNQFIQ